MENSLDNYLEYVQEDLLTIASAGALGLVLAGASSKLVDVIHKSYSR